MKLTRYFYILALMVVLGIPAVVAETETTEATTTISSERDVFADADEAARQSSNPLGGDFLIWINQWNIDFQEGDITSKTRNAYTLISQGNYP